MTNCCCKRTRIISDLTLPCLANANRLLRVLEYLGYLPSEKIKIVINRFLENSQFSITDAQDSIKKEIYWTIPNDYRTIVDAINQGQALCQIAPKAPITKNIQKLAYTLMQKEYEEETNKKRWKLNLRDIINKGMKQRKLA